MIDPLCGVWGKVERAQEHRDALGAVFDSWLDRSPYGVAGELDPETGWFVMTLREFEPPPLQLGLIFGDMVSNLRAALDHLVWQLVLVNGMVPTSQTGFPISTDANQWGPMKGRNLVGVANHWVDEIERVQPFHQGGRAVLHPLAVLNQVNNINKHRVVSAVAVTTFEWQPTFVLNRPAEEGDWVAHELIPLPPGWKLKDGAMLGRLRADSSKGDLQITRIEKIEDVAIGVGFDDGLEHEGAFPDLIGEVSATVSGFKSAFDA
ncbi:MAG: hypothetical protein ACRDJG_02040 [Actinomycetota bacterium]